MLSHSFTINITFIGYKLFDYFISCYVNFIINLENIRILCFMHLTLTILMLFYQ
jgi:hypothetical protein